MKLIYCEDGPAFGAHDLVPHLGERDSYTIKVGGTPFTYVRTDREIATYDGPAIVYKLKPEPPK